MSRYAEIRYKDDTSATSPQLAHGALLYQWRTGTLKSSGELYLRCARCDFRYFCDKRDADACLLSEGSSSALGPVLLFVASTAADVTDVPSQWSPIFGEENRNITHIHYRVVLAPGRSIQSPELVEPPAEGATSPDVIDEALEKELSGLLESGRDQYFEDGVETNFSRRLIRFIAKFGARAVTALSRLVPSTPARVVAECLRWLPHVEGSASYRERRWLLESSLSAKSPLVRDAAVVALGTMNDRHSVPYLRAAAGRETISTLRDQMEELATEVQESSAA